MSIIHVCILHLEALLIKTIACCVIVAVDSVCVEVRHLLYLLYSAAGCTLSVLSAGPAAPLLPG